MRTVRKWGYPEAANFFLQKNWKYVPQTFLFANCRYESFFANCCSRQPFGNSSIQLFHLQIVVMNNYFCELALSIIF